MIGESIKQAVHSVLSNKMRSFLTMLGMIIGVLSLVVLVSIVNGATSSVTDSISSIGTNYLTIQIQDDKGTPFTLEELEEIAEKGAVAATAPIAQGNATAKYDRTSSSISLRGTTGAYYEIQGLSLARGRFLKNADVNQKSQVAVINATAAEELFGNTNVVGEVFSIDGYKFTVIGVLEEQDSAIGNVSERLEAYIPFTVLSKISGSSREITSFYASSADEKSMDKVEAEMTAYLYKRLGDTDSFSVVNASSVMEAMTSVTDTMKLMLGGIAAISLLVGGIGIMNIMLVSVTERTREIGIHKAIGARKKNIMMQFLIEALLVSVTGCLIGLLLSCLTVFGINHFMTSISAVISADVVFIAIGFSMLIGMVFGLYPAWKAANMRPIDALRQM
ncbi:MAG: ABC transporter permease [Clostridiales bacterium]|nr:ABC transporter permease [Clostridiales bacterium]